MNQNKAKQIFEHWQKEQERIEKEAKANGIWKEFGFDSNNHLFKQLDFETKEKLKSLKLSDDE